MLTKRHHDDLSIPKPTERPRGKTIDLLRKSFTKPQGGQPQAVNVNPFGEVPETLAIVRPRRLYS